MNSSIRSFALGAVAPALFLAACDRSPVEPHDHHQLGTVSFSTAHHTAHASPRGPTPAAGTRRTS
jgi:hypothetical protein